MKPFYGEKEQFFPQKEHETYFQHLPHLFDVYNIPSPRRVSHHTLNINKAIKKMDIRSEEKSTLMPITQTDSSLVTSKRMHVPSSKGLCTVSREERKAILGAQTLIYNTVKVMTEDDPK